MIAKLDSIFFSSFFSPNIICVRVCMWVRFFVIVSSLLVAVNTIQIVMVPTIKILVDTKE